MAQYSKLLSSYSKFTLALTLSLPALSLAQTADWVFYNGQLITMDEHQPKAQAMAISGNQIVAVGDNDSMASFIGNATQKLDLQGKTIIPGLIDAHLHGIRGGRTYLFETYWYDVKNVDQALNKLKQTAQTKPKNEWVAVVGSWIPEQLKENRAPTMTELTQAVPDHPVYIQSNYDFAILNQKGIETLALNSPTPHIPKGIVIERNQQGQATGKLTGNIGSYNQLFAQISQDADVMQNLEAFMTALNSVGVTGFIDPSAGGDQAYQDIFTLQANYKTPKMRIAYRLSSTPNDEVNWFKERLAFTPPSFTYHNVTFLGLGENLVMAMNDGVKQSNGFSSNDQAKDKMYEILTLAAQKGTSVELHAYTDDSAEGLLKVLEAVAEEHDITELRWSIAHLNTGSEETLDRMKALGLSYSVQMGPYFETPAILKATDSTASQESSPIKKAMNKGIKVVGGTDATRIGIAGVWHAIEYHVTGKPLGNQVQKPNHSLLSVEDALKLYTINAAWITKDEQYRGSLTQGKLADFVILDQDILTVSPEKLSETQSIITFVDGQPVYQAP